MRANVTEELRAQQDHMLLLGRKTALERVVTFLLWFAGRAAKEEHAGSGGAVDFPVPRGDMADYLGLTTETVCRVMTALKQATVIDLPSPQRLSLMQGATLKDI